MIERSDGGVLEVREICFSYGGSVALDGCSFTIDSGMVVGLVGPNGAGKSTLIELISGALAPDSGTIKFDGVDLGRAGPQNAYRRGIVRTFQVSRVLPRLPVIENVIIGAPGQIGENPFRAILSRSSWRNQEAMLRKQAAELLQWVGLTDPDARAGTLSGGQLRLLEIARALMANPKLLLLDEPSAGVFPETARLIAARVREIASQRGVTIVVIAHNLGFLSDVTDDVIVMSLGKVLIRGRLESVRANPEVVSAYLGAPRVNTRP